MTVDELKELGERIEGTEFSLSSPGLPVQLSLYPLISWLIFTRVPLLFQVITVTICVSVFAIAVGALLSSVVELIAVTTREKWELSIRLYVRLPLSRTLCHGVLVCWCCRALCHLRQQW